MNCTTYAVVLVVGFASGLLLVVLALAAETDYRWCPKCGEPEPFGDACCEAGEDGDGEAT